MSPQTSAGFGRPCDFLQRMLDSVSEDQLQGQASGLDKVFSLQHTQLTAFVGWV